VTERLVVIFPVFGDVREMLMVAGAFLARLPILHVTVEFNDVQEPSVLVAAVSTVFAGRTIVGFPFKTGQPVKSKGYRQPSSLTFLAKEVLQLVLKAM